MPAAPRASWCRGPTPGLAAPLTRPSRTRPAWKTCASEQAVPLLRCTGPGESRGWLPAVKAEPPAGFVVDPAPVRAPPERTAVPRGPAAAQAGLPTGATEPPARTQAYSRTQAHAGTRPRSKPLLHFLGLPEYVGLQLLDDPSMSVSMASGTGLLATAALTWDDEALELAGAGADALPPLAPPDWRGRLSQSWRRRWPALAGSVWHPALGDGADPPPGASAAIARTGRP